jgi:hypothetical protein
MMLPTTCEPIAMSVRRARRCNIFVIRRKPALSARLSSYPQDRESDVDLALRLNVLAVLAVFAFVGAVLLGAF